MRAVLIVGVAALAVGLAAPTASAERRPVSVAQVRVALARAGFRPFDLSSFDGRDAYVRGIFMGFDPRRNGGSFHVLVCATPQIARFYRDHSPPPERHEDRIAIARNVVAYYPHTLAASAQRALLRALTGAAG